LQYYIAFRTRWVLFKLERKIALGRPRRRWEDNIKMDLREVVVRMWSGFM
jgi:hypothetical protein